MTRLKPLELERLAPLTDLQIVDRVLAGDVGAFELLMRRYNQRLFIAARSILNRDADAEDALQETYLRAYRSLESFRGRASIATWLTRITLNEALRVRNRIRRNLQIEQSDHAYRAFEKRQDREHVPKTGDEHRRMIYSALDTLSETERGVVLLRLVHGLATRDTAESMNMSESNIKVVLHRARRKLADSLNEAARAELKRELSFDGTRCDNIVNRVFARLASPDTHRGADNDAMV